MANSTENISEDAKLNKTETIAILNKFYGECVEFWRREGSSTPYTDALGDIKRLTRNPYEPCGKLLEEHGKKLVVDVLESVIEEGE